MHLVSDYGSEGLSSPRNAVSTRMVDGRMTTWWADGRVLESDELLQTTMAGPGFVAVCLSSFMSTHHCLYLERRERDAYPGKADLSIGSRKAIYTRFPTDYPYP